MLSSRIWIVFLIGLMVSNSGCGSSSSAGPDEASESAHGHEHEHEHEHGHEHEHEHGHTDMSFTSAVTQLAAHQATIASAFAAGKPDDCHDALHSVGNLLTALPELAADTALPRDEWQQVKDASAALMKAFGRIDAKMHGDQDGCDYAEVAATIEEHLETLTALAQQVTGEDPAAAADAEADNQVGADGATAS